MILYIRIPFCPVRCAHCAKPIVTAEDPVLTDRYFDALRRELEACAGQYEDFDIRAVYVGGGTPGHMCDEKLGALLRELRAWLPVAADVEITLKIHPGMFSAETLLACRRGGVNRLSIEYISALDAECEPFERFLPPGAMDTTRQILGETEMKLSFDVLTGLPGQTPGTVQQTLQRGVDYGASAVELFPLRAEPGTLFCDRWLPAHGNSGVRTHIPTGQELTTITSAADAWLMEHGFTAYLPGCYARPGCESRRKVLASKGAEQLGVGAGAESLLDGFISRNIGDVRDYCRFSPNPVMLTEFSMPAQA